MQLEEVVLKTAPTTAAFRPSPTQPQPPTCTLKMGAGPSSQSAATSMASLTRPPGLFRRSRMKASAPSRCAGGWGRGVGCGACVGVGVGGGGAEGQEHMHHAAAPGAGRWHAAYPRQRSG